MCHNGWMPLTESQHIAMFGDHWPSTRGDTMYLIYHMTSQDHLIQGSCEFDQVGTAACYELGTPHFNSLVWHVW